MSLTSRYAFLSSFDSVELLDFEVRCFPDFSPVLVHPDSFIENY
jgi:hypothetical protein